MSDSEYDINDEDRDRVVNLTDQRVVPSTKKAYLAGINQFQTWLQEKYPRWLETVDGVVRIKVGLLLLNPHFVIKNFVCHST